MGVQILEEKFHFIVTHLKSTLDLQLLLTWIVAIKIPKNIRCPVRRNL